MDLAALVESCSHYRNPENFRLAYGTAGFRAEAKLLPATVFRWALCSKKPIIKLPRIFSTFCMALYHVEEAVAHSYSVAMTFIIALLGAPEGCVVVCADVVF